MIQKKKLFIQIPCFNEEKTLPLVIADLPRKIEGIDEIYTLVIDDGSTDLTVEVAKDIGIDFIVRNHRNIGLAKTFSRGLEACLFLGADIIVNTDGDNQYCGDDIENIVKPIIKENADIVIGCRDIAGHVEFSWTKKTLQKIGSKVVRVISGTNVPDATSGFRAMNRSAAIRFSSLTDFSYTLEMLIQAGYSGLKIAWTSIRTNIKSRGSRLFRSNSQFVFQQLKTILSAYIFYRPMKIFGFLSLISLLTSIILSFRMMYFLWFLDPDITKVKAGSAVMLSFSSSATLLFAVAGILGSVLSGLRHMSIDIRNRIRNYELHQNIPPFNIDIITANNFFRWANKGKGKCLKNDYRYGKQ